MQTPSLFSKPQANLQTGQKSEPYRADPDWTRQANLALAKAFPELNDVQIHDLASMLSRMKHYESVPAEEAVEEWSKDFRDPARA